MKFIALAFILLGPLQLHGQINLDSAKIYLYFDTLGMTTMGAKTQFSNLKDQNILLESLDSNELGTLNSILNNSKSKKHIQTKIGMYNNYFLVYYNGDAHPLLLTRRWIINFEDLKQYDIDSISRIKLDDIIIKYRE